MKNEKLLNALEALGIKVTVYEGSVLDEEKLKSSKQMKIANEVASRLIIMDDPENCEEEKDQ